MKRCFLVVLLLLAQTVCSGTLSTFTLPPKDPCEGSYYIDIQASFPQVDFDTLDRLYIPAGHYKFYRIGNLPQRSASNPLVISNIGGQVRVGGCGHHYNLNLSGGSNWKLTGEYSQSEQTGDVGFQGHANGQYANSADTYGILIDADFGSGNIGLAVGGGSTEYEVSFLEVRNLNFAGMMFKTDDNGTAHMNNVKIHNNYIHDTISEGVYLGSTQSQPQHKFNDLEFYNNRLIRTGTEIAQFGNLGDNCRIHHNVFVLGALGWKNPFQNYQDSGIQIGHREGSASFDHNIVIGGASNNLILFNPDVAGDVHNPGDLLSINNNYFAYSRDIAVYIHSSDHDNKEVAFTNNYFSNVVFSYDELDAGATDHQRFIRSFNQQNPITLSDNFFDDQPGQGFYSGYGNITANNNQSQLINEVEFYNLGWPGAGDYFTMEIWTAEDINNQTVSYEAGDLVVHEGLIYLALRDFDYANEPHITPDQASGSDWQLKPPMADDVRQLYDAEFADIGLLDVVLTDVIFAHGFESNKKG
jgi:hypothetical protein